MAVDKIPNYNRIIDLTLISTNGKRIQVPQGGCPRRGRKPSIEINASYAANNTLMPFNIKIKNLYLDLIPVQYARVEMKVGYENNNIDMAGSILSIYQESPGPEGSTIIQCEMGDFQTWLDAAVQLNFEAKTPLEKVLEEIKGKMGATSVVIKPSAKALTLETPFPFDGTARGALAELEKLFQEEKLHVFLRNETLCAICYTKNDFINSHKLEYMSAPPQPNAGTSEATAYTTVTAPWLPQLNIGDRLEVPQKTYVRYKTTVNASAKATQFIQIYSMSIHFGTTGGVNSMTVQGFNVKE